MNKTGSIIVKVILGLVIISLSVVIVLCVVRPQQREAEFFTRRDACGEKLKVIRTLEEAHKAAYGTYCGNWDTLLYNLQQPNQRVIRRVLSPTAPPADSVYNIPELEAIKNGWLIQEEGKIVPLLKLYEDKKLTFMDTNLLTGQTPERQIEIIVENVKDVIYVPYTHHQSKFIIQSDSVSASISGEGSKLPTFVAYVELDTLFADYIKTKDNHNPLELFTGSDYQWLLNKKAELKEMDRFLGWKVGDLESPITEGNFE
ncbi:MAG: hypothetical protein K5864_00125 [Bacteroidales bacterium]|nr:hypothetical protein [Bacteroidales bacterium]